MYYYVCTNMQTESIVHESRREREDKSKRVARLLKTERKQSRMFYEKAQLRHRVQQAKNRKLEEALSIAKRAISKRDIIIREKQRAILKFQKLCRDGSPIRSSMNTEGKLMRKPWRTTMKLITSDRCRAV